MAYASAVTSSGVRRVLAVGGGTASGGDPRGVFGRLVPRERRSDHHHDRHRLVALHSTTHAKSGVVAKKRAATKAAKKRAVAKSRSRPSRLPLGNCRPARRVVSQSQLAITRCTDEHDGAVGIPLGDRRRRHDSAHGAADHADTVGPKPYDPTKPIDLGGTPGVTPAQQARAEQLVRDTLRDLPRYANPATAYADGFRSIGDLLHRQRALRQVVVRRRRPHPRLEVSRVARLPVPQRCEDLGVRDVHAAVRGAVHGHT